jgi:hypothetical protein
LLFDLLHRQFLPLPSGNKLMEWLRPQLTRLIENATGTNEQNDAATQQQRRRACNNVNKKQIETNRSILQSIRGFVKRHQAKGTCPREVQHALDALACAVTFELGTNSQSAIVDAVLLS